MVVHKKTLKRHEVTERVEIITFNDETMTQDSQFSIYEIIKTQFGDDKMSFYNLIHTCKKNVINSLINTQSLCNKRTWLYNILGIFISFRWAKTCLDNYHDSLSIFLFTTFTTKISK